MLSGGLFSAINEFERVIGAFPQTIKAGHAVIEAASALKSVLKARVRQRVHRRVARLRREQPLPLECAFVSNLGETRAQIVASTSGSNSGEVLLRIMDPVGIDTFDAIRQWFEAHAAWETVPITMETT